jgi:SAM-dependent methyltransferase
MRDRNLDWVSSSYNFSGAIITYCAALAYVLKRGKNLIAESFGMRLLRKMGFDRAAWSIRKLHCPVGKHDLVLEVGSGGNPYPRSNVLVDGYESTRERHWVPLVKNRPTVLAMAEKLPFPDKTFDFVIASHVLEHTSDPDQFLRELQRVAKAGYIETPDAFMERVNPYLDHRLEVTSRDAGLVVKKKSQWNPDQELVELYEFRAKHNFTTEHIPSRPFDYHLRYYWSDSIKYTIVNPDVEANWKPLETPNIVPTSSLKSSLRMTLNHILQRPFLQSNRNAAIDLLSLVRCTTCTVGRLCIPVRSITRCLDCGESFLYDGNLLKMVK